MAIRDRESGGREFVSASEYELIKQTLIEFSADSDYQTLEYVYERFKSALDTAQKLELASLFNEQLATLLTRKATPVLAAVDEISIKLQRYISRLSETAAMLSGVARPTPK